jgi:hypothetical protein
MGKVELAVLTLNTSIVPDGFVLYTISAVCCSELTLPSSRILTARRTMSIPRRIWRAKEKGQWLCEINISVDKQARFKRF